MRCCAIFMFNMRFDPSLERYDRKPVERARLVVRKGTIMKRLLSFGILSAAIIGLSGISASAAPITPPAAPTEAASQAEQVHRRHYRHRRHYHRRHYGYRHYYRPRVYYAPRYYGYRRHYYDHPYVYGGIGVPFIGLSFGGGPRYYRHRHYRRW
jgi:hypothetical protein